MKQVNKIVVGFIITFLSFMVLLFSCNESKNVQKQDLDVIDSVRTKMEINFQDLKSIKIFCWCFGDESKFCTTPASLRASSLINKECFFDSIVNKDKIRILEKNLFAKMIEPSKWNDSRLVFLVEFSNRIDTIIYFKDSTVSFNMNLYKFNKNFIKEIESIVGKKIKCK